MKVLIIDPIHESLQKNLEERGHECLNLSEHSDKSVLSSVPSANVLVLRSRMSISKEIIDQSTRLKIIARVGAGLEHIDVNYAESKGIKILSSPEGNRQAVAEHALGMLLSLLNKIPKSSNEVRNDSWIRKENQGVELCGKTVAIIGYGNTGSAFAQVLTGFGVRILAFDKYKPEYSHASSMEEIFKEADIVSLHLPLTDETQYLVDETWLAKFKRPIYLINTSRGAIVYTKDLLSGLENSSVLGACLDVVEFETENLKMPDLKELPAEAMRLFNHPNVLITPHIAGLTDESYEKLSSILARKIATELDEF